MTATTEHNDRIEEALERLLAGERPDEILASYPGAGAELWSLLEAASALVHAPAPLPSPSARNAALSRMLTQVAEQAAAPAPGGVLAWLGTLRARPLAYQATAIAAAVVLFAGLGIGASAATGTTPEPVRTFFRLPDDSGRTTHLQGVVVSASDAALVLDTGAARTTVQLAPTTLIHRGNLQIAAADLRPGERVQVTVHERGGQRTVVRIDVLPPPAATAGAGGGPQAGPTGDHADATAPRGTPQADQTSGPDGHGGAGPGRDDATRTGTPGATRTPEGDHGGGDSGNGSATPNVTRTPEPEHDATPDASRTPKPTRTPDKTPEPTETPHPAGN